MSTQTTMDLEYKGVEVNTERVPESVNRLHEYWKQLVCGGAGECD